MYQCFHEDALFLYINAGLLSSAVPDVSWRVGPGHFPPRGSSHRSWTTHGGLRLLHTYPNGLAECRIRQNGQCIIEPHIWLVYYAVFLWVIHCGVHAIVFFLRRRLVTVICQWMLPQTSTAEGHEGNCL